MNPLKAISALVLSLGLVLVATQVPAGAADDKADKKAKRKKLLEAKKAKGDEVPKPVVTVGAKPAPTNIQPPKTPARPMATAALAGVIDRGIDTRLEQAMIKPSGDATDAEFLRRAYLDIAGVIPPADKAVAFLDDKSPDKRARLVDELLRHPGFGKRMGDIWTTLMYPIDSDNRFVSKAPLREWLTDEFNNNRPWDQMAYELITATGEVDKGATVYAMSNRGVDKMTDSVGKLFLGQQIQCAQCHNHPFTSYKQTEYWGLAQFFYKVNVSNPRAAKDGGTITVSEEGRVNRKINPLPEAAKEVTAKYLGGDTIRLDPAKPYRPVLAQWVASPSNPYFAKAFVNRLWAQYFGRGFVHPVDDMSRENEPTHPELLAALAKEFADSGFDVKHLVRGICNSKAYQRTSKPAGDNRDDRTLFSHQAIKVLSGEQLYDSLVSVVGSPGNPNRPAPKAAPKGGPQGPRDQFALFFAGTENAPPTEYEAGIPQALRLMNGPLMAAGRMSAVAAKVGDVSKTSPPPQVIEKLYLTAFARRPTADETKRMTDFVAKAADPRSGYGDVLWVLLNSSEFALNR
ncbi:MAG TPA: DUF1549 and DUF1553 domain-containing protein [Gemmataceae bacterium]|jgi:hypothetical protein|nr:DUF1549 and DUF1553 domain-containing protein [Gemmataceae bacterium]